MFNLDLVRYYIKYYANYDFQKDADDREMGLLEELIRVTPDDEERSKFERRLVQLQNKSPFAKRKS